MYANMTFQKLSECIDIIDPENKQIPISLEKKQEAINIAKDIIFDETEHLVEHLTSHLDDLSNYEKLKNRIKDINDKDLNPIYAQLININNVATTLNQSHRSLADFDNFELPVDIEADRKDIDKLRDLPQEIQNLVMPRLINHQNAPLKNFSLDEIKEMGAGLTHLNLGGKDWTEKELEEIFKACPHVLKLEIHSKNIQRLPIELLKYCEEIDCSGCTNLEKLPEVPYCKIIKIINCINIDSLPQLLKCEKLVANNSGIRDLPEMPNVKILLIDHTRIERLPQLLNCIILNCSFTLISEIPKMLKLRELSCNNLPELKRLPLLPDLDILNCSHCDLSELPQFLKLTRLNCADNPRLSALPNLENLTHLNCQDCTSLIQLQLFANLLVLNCSGNNFTELPPLNKLKDLDCSHCRFLNSLPSLNNCEIVNCAACILISVLQGLERCRNLNCSDCIALIQLPALPECRELFYDGCHLLDLSTVPPDLLERMYASRGTVVKVIDLNDNPIKVLLEVYSRLLNGAELPRIIFMEPNGEIAEGQDGGGLTSILITRLLQSLISNKDNQGQLGFAEREGFCLPTLNIDAGKGADQVASFRILGSLFVHCFLTERTIGGAFYPPFFDALLAFSSEELDAMPENVNDLADDVRLKISTMIDGNDQILRILNTSPEELSQSKEELEKTKAQIQQYKWQFEAYEDVAVFEAEEPFGIPPGLNPLDEAKFLHGELKRLYLKSQRVLSDFVLPIAIIAKQLKKDTARFEMEWEEIRENGGSMLREQISGITLDAEAIKELTRFGEIDIQISEEMKATMTQEEIDKYIKDTQDAQIRTKQWLFEWMDKASPEDLRKFIYAISGQDSLPEGANLSVHLKNRSHLPKFHTCHKSMELSIKWSEQDQEKFNEQLVLAIVTANDKTNSGVPND